MLIIKLKTVHACKQARQVRVELFRVGRLAEDCQQSAVRDEEEAWKQQSLFLQIAVRTQETRCRQACLLRGWLYGTVPGAPRRN